MLMDQIDRCLETLSKILNTFKKSPNRRYQKSTLRTKLFVAKCLYDEILEKK